MIENGIFQAIFLSLLTNTISDVEVQNQMSEKYSSVEPSSCSKRAVGYEMLQSAMSYAHGMKMILSEILLFAKKKPSRELCDTAVYYKKENNAAMKQSWVWVSSNFYNHLYNINFALDYVN